MKICYLGSSSSYHIQKWCHYFSKLGNDVHLITFDKQEIDGITIHHIKTGMKNRYDSDTKKISYLLHGREIRRIINNIDPHIIHAHRIPSYGGACAIGNITPFVLSVWGGDIYDFPKKSILHKYLTEYVLNKANYIFSTSHVMGDEIKKYTSKEVIITPFGVNIDLFNPSKRKKENDRFVIGSIKGLEIRYGIEYLLKAAAIVKKIRSDIPLEVRIAGSGSDQKRLEGMSISLGIDGIVEWLGFIDQNQVASEWANMDVAIVPSITDSESFGVSAVEAQACGIPVIISDTPGLKEATKPGITSIVVPKCDEQQIAEQIIFLYDNPSSRNKMGSEGRNYVAERFSIDKCFGDVERIYQNIVRESNESHSS